MWEVSGEGLPVIVTTAFPRSKADLAQLGWDRAVEFCQLNGLPVPAFNPTPRARWVVSACAFYRPDTERFRKFTTPGVNICLELCAAPCDESPGRNWSWPGSTTDRTPYGVVAHEIGHHVDWLTGEHKGDYFSEFSEQAKAASGEPGLTSYAEQNPAEWFAEAFRLFVTNADLLRQVRPKTFAFLRERWRPVGERSWLESLGANVPAKVVKAMKNKGAR